MIILASNLKEKSKVIKRDLRNMIFNLPKIDLHRHLEGSLRLSTLADIAHQHGVDFTCVDVIINTSWIWFYNIIGV